MSDLGALMGKAGSIQMIDLRAVPIVRVLIPFALGSLTGYADFLEAGSVSLLSLCALSAVSAALFYHKSQGRRRLFHWGYSISVLLLYSVLGVVTGRIDRPRDPGIPGDGLVLLMGNIEDDPVTRNGKLQFHMELKLAYSGDSLFRERCLLKVYVSPAISRISPEAGETWYLSGRLYPVQNSGNPGEVDYASIMRRKNCWYYFYCDSTGLNEKLPEPAQRIPGPAVLRSSLSKYWEGKPETRALLSAVCLGERAGLSSELRQSYSMAGGMHVLAVSGLHVGLIWWVLNRLLSAFLPKGRNELFRVVFIILTLWVFAYMTGFSSSVSRSVTMFTFYSLSRIVKHRSHPVNAILVSMFFLILVHPGRLLDAGFQLSYSAILSIVTLHPVFMRVWRPGNRLVRWLWEATCLSLAAQAGTLPLVILYFHQLPLYGLLSNLVLVPLLSCIITIFVISAPMALSGIGAGLSNYLLMLTGGLMNSIVEVVASFPGALLGGLFMNRLTAVILMILIILFIDVLNRKKRACLWLIGVLLCLMSVLSAANKSSELHEAETRVSHFRGGSMITFRQGFKVDHYILTDDPVTVSYMDRYISTAWGRRSYEVSVIRIPGQGSPHGLCGGISCVSEIGNGLFLLGNDDICALVISGKQTLLKPVFLTGLDPDFILLSDEPVLENVPFQSSCSLVVTDGSNRKWYVEKLQIRHLDLYDTASRGAFVLKD